MSKNNFLLSEPDAKNQLDIFFDWYDIDFDEVIESAREVEGEGPLLTVYRTLIKAIRRGLLEIKNTQQNNEPTLIVVQKLKRPIGDIKEIRYNEITGRVQMAVRPGKKVSDEARMYDFLGVVCGEGAELFGGLRGGDIRVTRALGYLFLMV